MVASTSPALTVLPAVTFSVNRRSADDIRLKERSVCWTASIWPTTVTVELRSPSVADTTCVYEPSAVVLVLWAATLLV